MTPLDPDCAVCLGETMLPDPNCECDPTTPYVVCPEIERQAVVPHGYIPCPACRPKSDRRSSTEPKVPLYDTQRGWLERRVPLSLAEMEELIALISDDGTPDEDALGQIERKLLFHRARLLDDMGEQPPEETQRDQRSA